jgi:hypothetical protein
MWAATVGLIGALLSFVGAMLGVRIKSKDLKQQLEQAHGDLELKLQEAHSDLKLQLLEAPGDLERSIDAQANDLRQQLTFEGKGTSGPSTPLHWQR